MNLFIRAGLLVVFYFHPLATGEQLFGIEKPNNRTPRVCIDSQRECRSYRERRAVSSAIKKKNLRSDK